MHAKKNCTQTMRAITAGADPQSVAGISQSIIFAASTRQDTCELMPNTMIKSGDGSGHSTCSWAVFTDRSGINYGPVVMVPLLIFSVSETGCSRNPNCNREQLSRLK